MNSISHQQRMMEIQHMSNACLVTLLPRVQESLQGTNKEGCVHLIYLYIYKSFGGLNGWSSKSWSIFPFQREKGWH